MDTLCPNCHHAEAHSGGALGVCLHDGCGCDNTTAATPADVSLDGRHDPLCPVYGGPCCPWMGDCDCQCLCDFLHQVRTHERARWNSGHWSEDWHRGYAQGIDDALHTPPENQIGKGGGNGNDATA